MTLQLANSVVLGFLAALALLLCGWGLATRSTSRAAWPMVGLGISFSFYAATPFVYEARNEVGPLFALTLFGESFVPIAFWYTLAALFDDGFRWKPVHALGLVAGAASLVHVTWGWALGGQYFNPNLAVTYFSVLIVKMSHLGAIVGGLVAALKGWRADLINRRRQVRLVVMVLCGLGLLTMILSDYYLVSLRTLESPLLLGVNAFVVAVLLGAHLFLAANRDILAPAPRPKLAEDGEAEDARPPQTDAESMALAKLNRAMIVDKLFTQEGLTLGDLASKLHLPEYRLRQIINQRLGYRNFNQFLANHRIALAKSKLADPASQNDKIISIAFDVGYGSLAPFNKAFKDLTGLTPSAFRAAALEKGARQAPRADNP